MAGKIEAPACMPLAPQSRAYGCTSSCPFHLLSLCLLLLLCLWSVRPMPFCTLLLQVFLLSSPFSARPVTSSAPSSPKPCQLAQVSLVSKQSRYLPSVLCPPLNIAVSFPTRSRTLLSRLYSLQSGFCPRHAPEIALARFARIGLT